MSILKPHVNSSPNFGSFFTFECSGGNLPNSSCHFLNHKSVFLQICLQTLHCHETGDRGELGIPNLTRMSLMKCYWILQNARVTALLFLRYEGKTNKGRVKLPPPPPHTHTHTHTQIRLKVKIFETFECSHQIPCVIFQTTSHFFFKFVIALKYHER